MRDSLTIQTIVLLAGRLSKAGIQIILPIILVRLISPGDYGIYKFIFLVQGTIFVALPMGMIQSLYFFVPKGQTPKIYIRQSLLYLHLISGLVLAIGFIFSVPFSQIIKAENNYLLYLIVLPSLILPILSAPIEITLLAEKKAHYASLVTVVNGLFSTGILLGCAIIFRTIYALMIGLLVHCFLKLLITEIYFQKRYKIFTLDGINRQSLRAHFSFAIPLGAAGLAGFLQVRLDHYVVSYYFDSAMYATYAVAAFGIPFAVYFYNSVADVTIVRYRQLALNNQLNEMILVWDKATRRLSTVFVPLVVLFLLLADPLVPFLFTEKFAGAIPFYRVLLLLWLSYCFNPASFVRAFRTTRYLLFVQMACMIVSCVSLLILVKYFGMLGAAISCVSVVWLSTILLTQKVASLASTSIINLIPIRHFCKVFLSTGLAACLLIILRMSIKGALPYLVIGTITFCIVYLIVVWRIGVLAEEDKKLFFGFLKKGVEM
ncbi:MAG: oligosaccharide flippase family protein, partial [Candidatus Omnitrophica bacterium]|nr:oligosaccharide flippase family protein [Candidatus Omnitrophota bacterium]